MPVIVAANTKGAEINIISYADKIRNFFVDAIFAYFMISHLPEKYSQHLHTTQRDLLQSKSDLNMIYNVHLLNSHTLLIVHVDKDILTESMHL